MSRTHSILLVEDSPTQAIHLTDNFEREGWRVDWARTAEAALQRLNQATPDGIVLDLYLPGIRGDELCRRVRMNAATRNLPILMLTADDDQHAESHALESGADDFVSKLAHPDVLIMRLRTLLAKSRAQAAGSVSSDNRLRAAKLLSIDDSQTYQEFLSQELQTQGYLVERAMHGLEGLKRIAQGGLDCILVDLVMPDLDGIEVCRRINVLRQSMESPVAVLMLTARENKEDLTSALEAGADDFVAKSSDMAVLKGRIQALLRRKSFEEENRRIQNELRERELETLQALAEKDIAETKAALNTELEQRVIERTAELAQVNCELANKNLENETFVYSVSHDLRSPLVNLQGFSEELAVVCRELRGILSEKELLAPARERGIALLDEDMSQSIHFIQTAVTRLSTIIDALLRLSRAGRVEYEHQRVDLQGVVQRIVESMSATAAQRQAQVTVRPLVPVWGDPTAIEQVFANLISNALNYLAPERAGDVEIGCSEGEPSPAEPSAVPYVTYYVRDNGLGIPHAYQSKLFHAFQRLHPQVAAGEGMGLAIVRRIVERHGGRIWLHSEVGEGTTFFVSLPAQLQDESYVQADNTNRTADVRQEICQSHP